MLQRSRERHEIQIPPHYTPDRPEAETRHLETDQYNEQLKEPFHHPDHRPIAVKKRGPVLVPEYNKLYGTGRSQGDWRYFVDCYAKGTFTTVANTAVNVNVVLANQPNFRLSQWPGAIHLYLNLRKFSCAPQSAIGTVGAIDVLYTDFAGNVIPLGDFVSSSNINEDEQIIIPSTIVDPSNILTTVGTLTVTLSGTTPTVSVYNYQLSYSAVYVLPSLEGYESESIHRVLHRSGQDI